MAASTPAWRKETILPESWRLPFPEQMLEPFEELRSVPEDLTSFRLPPHLRDFCRGCCARMAQELEHGCGFIVVEAPRRKLDDRQRTLMYWLVGYGLGQPVTQNVQGVLLYDVRDTGQDVRSGARFSITNAESSFHTDASFCDDIVDYVGLLCLKPARTGGISQVVSGRTAEQELARRSPEALAILQKPFHVDKRGGAKPGESATALFPVLAREQDPVFRYLRYWIEAGHTKIEQPLSEEQTRALDALDAVLGDPALRVEFVMRPGEMFFVNNRWVLHNRTSFEDFDEPERRRHLVRLWVAKDRVTVSPATA